MKRDRGMTGFFAGTSLAAVSLFTCEVFSVDPKTAYENGNSTYLALPLAVIVSLVALIPAILAGRGEKDGLAGLFSYAFGRVGGAFAAIVLSLSFIRAAAKPMTAFALVLSRLVFDGVPYTRIMLYLIPVTVLIALKGFESAGRLALIFSGLILASVVTAALTASSEFAAYRLYPLPSANADTAKTVWSGIVFALPPLAALFVNGESLGGVKNVRKTAAAAAFGSAAAIGLTQLALALIYPHRVLSGLLMPLYRINFLSLRQSYALRLDKLFIFIWLTGCVISCSYLILSAALLIKKAFCAQKGVPAVLAVSAAVFFSVTAEFSQNYAAAAYIESFFSRFGTLFALVPTLAAAALGGIRKRREARP